MDERVTLRSHLDQSSSQTPHGAAVGEVIEAIATAAVDLAALIADGPLAGITGRNDGTNPDGDQQKDIDIAADDMMRPRLAQKPRSQQFFQSGTAVDPQCRGAAFASRIDPLDRPTSKTTSLGAIFSIRPQRHSIDLLLNPARRSARQGFVVHGSANHAGALALNARRYSFSTAARGIPGPRRASAAPATPEFAINASNRRHWHGTCSRVIDECLAAQRRRRCRFQYALDRLINAESLRIPVRGGVFLSGRCPPGYREQASRFSEAHPMALVMEWAGGAATTGRRRILELGAKTPHQRVPLIMGSARGVRDVAAIHEGIEPMFDNSDAPLFARRGLFR